MTIMYEGHDGLRTPPQPTCRDRCAACIADALADSVGPHSVWYRLIALRIPTCRRCHGHTCRGAASCANPCDTPADQITPPNRDTRILPDLPISPPPPDR